MRPRTTFSCNETGWVWARHSHWKNASLHGAHCQWILMLGTSQQEVSYSQHPQWNSFLHTGGWILSSANCTWTMSTNLHSPDWILLKSFDDTSGPAKMWLWPFCLSWTFPPTDQPFCHHPDYPSMAFCFLYSMFGLTFLQHKIGDRELDTRCHFYTSQCFLTNCCCKNHG